MSKQKELNLIDELRLNLALKQKAMMYEPSSSEKSITLAKQIADKIVYSCNSLSGRMSEQANWNKRQSVFETYSRFKRLFKILSSAIDLTSGQEGLDVQAKRWVTPVQKFFDLYLSLLAETEKHLEDIDESIGISAITEEDLAEFKLILEDDMVQEIFSSNHLILELVKESPTSSSTLKQILSNYVG